MGSNIGREILDDCTSYRFCDFSHTGSLFWVILLRHVEVAAGNSKSNPAGAQ